MDTITIAMMEFLVNIKLFHWQTGLYSAHEAVQELEENFEDDMDAFLEAMQGIEGYRIPSISTNLRMKSLSLSQMNVYCRKYIKWFEKVDLKYGALDNIREEMIGHIEKFLYLLSFDHSRY